MWPWMNQGFSPMYGMGGGFGMMQPQYNPQQQMQGAEQGNARIDKLRGRVNNLQEQMKGAGTQDMAGIQARMDQMQGRIKNLRQDRRQGEGMFAQPEGGNTTGNTPAMGPMPPGFGMYGGGGYGVGGMGMGGGMPQYGGMNYDPRQYNPNNANGPVPPGMKRIGLFEGGQGGYSYVPDTPGATMGVNDIGTMMRNRNPQMMQQLQAMGGNQTGLAEQGQMPTGANRPGMQYRQDRRQARQGGPEGASVPSNMGQPQGGAPSWYEAGSFDTPFGNLVQSSVGNGNIYKQNGSDGQSLYHYDPTQGWKHMTQQEYMGYNNPADFYQDPNQYAAAAGGNKSQMQMRNGMWQVQQGTGTYR